MILIHKFLTEKKHVIHRRCWIQYGVTLNGWIHGYMDNICRETWIVYYNPDTTVTATDYK